MELFKVRRVVLGTQVAQPRTRFAANTGAHIDFAGPAGFEAAGNAALGEQAGDEELAVLVVEFHGIEIEVEALVSRAFPAEEFAFESEPLGEDRKAEGSPEHFAFSRLEQTVFHGIEDHDCVGEFGQCHQTRLDAGDDLPEQGRSGGEGTGT